MANRHRARSDRSWFANRVELDFTPGGAGVFVFEDKDGNARAYRPARGADRSSHRAGSRSVVPS